MPVVKLQSKDGEIIEVEEEIARHCGLLDDMLNFLEQDEDADPILVRNVDSYMLKKVFSWIRHHNDPIKDDTETREWDEGFLRVEKIVLIKIMEAADFLNVVNLMDILGKHFANMIKGKSEEEIREMFLMENDFTPEEEEEVIRENSYGPDEVEKEVEDEVDDVEDTMDSRVFVRNARDWNIFHPDILHALPYFSVTEQ